MLQKVSIQNFKSLKDVTLELQKVNLLIGPNNSGKSNFLKALELFERLIRTTNWEESYRKERSNFYFKRDMENYPIKFKISEKLNSKYFYELTLQKNGRFERFYNDNKETSFENIGENKDIFKTNHSDLLNIYEKDENVDNLLTYISNIKIYTPNPSIFREAFPLIPFSEDIWEDGGNVVSFLDTMRDEYPENYKNIEDSLSKCIPEFSAFRFEKIENRESIDTLNKKYSYLVRLDGGKTFKRLGFYNHQQKMTYWADEVSEGVLYFLALLCIVHQPNPPKLLLLEEPEKGIHPRRIKEVLDFIFQLAEDKDIQVIMTTHNERVLDEFEDIPEAVFIFDKDEEGATQVKNLLKDVIEPSDKLMEENNVPKIKFTDSLGSHWVTGFIGGVPR